MKKKFNMKFEVLTLVNIKIMGCDATWFGIEVWKFQSNMLPPASGYKKEEASYSEMFVLLTCLGDITYHKMAKIKKWHVILQMRYTVADNPKFLPFYYCFTVISNLTIGAELYPFFQISERMTLRCPSVTEFTGLWTPPA